MISAPVTGPEEPPAGGGRLAVPSNSIVCSLTVAGTKQIIFLIFIYMGKQDYLLLGPFYLQAVMNFQIPTHTHTQLPKELKGILR